MIKHTIELSQRGMRVFYKKKQLKILYEGQERSYACEDIAVLILQNPAISITGQSLSALSEAGAIVIVCDTHRLPSGLYFPVHKHSQLIPRMQDQIAAKRPILKQAWKKIIQAKLRAQAKNLHSPFKEKLHYLSQQVKSGDRENHEAQAARIYWQEYFKEQYALGDQRDPFAETPFNSLLNYGYSVVRACLVRAIISAGLIPALGVFHKRRDNPFCLADDLIEPLRPLVDRTVQQLLKEKEKGSELLTREERRGMLSLITAQVQYDQMERPLLVSLPFYVNSYYSFITQNESEFRIPKII